MQETFEIAGCTFHFVSLVVGYILGVFLTYTTVKMIYLENHDETDPA